MINNNEEDIQEMKPSIPSSSISYWYLSTSAIFVRCLKKIQKEQIFFFFLINPPAAVLHNFDVRRGTSRRDSRDDWFSEKSFKILSLSEIKYTNPINRWFANKKKKNKIGKKPKWDKK